MAWTWAILLLLQNCLAFVLGSERSGWSWGSGVLESLTDEEIVDLLYTDPDRLRAMSKPNYNQGHDTSYTPLSENELEPPKFSGGLGSYDKEELTEEGRASSYTRVQHYSPRSRKKDSATYASHVLHS